MKIKTIFLTLSPLVAITAAPSAMAAGQTGAINFTGEVVDAACGLAPESVDQTVDFGQISKANLAAGNESTHQEFTLELVNCDTAGLTDGTVTASFVGAADSTDATELVANGSTGTSIYVSGMGGMVSFDGTPTQAANIQDGSNSLAFTSWVKASSNGTAVSEGAFTAVANFTLSYQ